MQLKQAENAQLLNNVLKQQCLIWNAMLDIIKKEMILDPVRSVMQVTSVTDQAELKEVVQEEVTVKELVIMVN